MILSGILKTLTLEQNRVPQEIHDKQLQEKEQLAALAFPQRDSIQQTP